MTRAFNSLLLALLSLTAAAEPADIIFVGEHIVTMDDRLRANQPTAVAIKGDTIVWLGSRDEMDSWQGQATEVIELGDQALLPGFIDAHGHFSYAAVTMNLANVASPPVGPVTDMASLGRTLSAYIDTRGITDGEWVVGFGYDDSLLAEGRHPTRDDLDAISTTHPIALTHVSGHLAAVNSAALVAIGYDASTEDPPGGHIRRRSGTTEPNGVLEESATYKLRAFTFSTPPDLEAAQANYASHGITTAQDGAANPQIIQLLRQAGRSGGLYMDVITYPMGQGEALIQSDDWSFGTYVDRVKVGGVKLMLDGSPQGKTAYLTAPYHVPPHGQDRFYRGYPSLPAEEMHRLVKHYVSAGIPIIAHANGDAAADVLIDSVAAATITDLPDHRTVVIHAQTLREDQLDHMRQLRMIPSYFSAHTFFWGDWHRDSVLGVRAMRISPTASTVARQMPFTVHNDAPVVPPHMMRLLWATTNRLTRSNQVLGAQQRIDIYDALKAVTVHAAYQAFEEDRKGTITVGKLADLVIVAENPLTTPKETLKDIAINRTYSHGKLIYGQTDG